MTAVTVFSVGALVLLALLITATGPNPYGPTDLSLTAAVDSVVGTSGSIPVQLVKHGYGGGAYFGGGGIYFGQGAYGGGWDWYNGSYSNYPYGGQGYYEQGNKTCVWNGYQYTCYKTR